jgi:hypothetical protein
MESAIFLVKSAPPRAGRAVRVGLHKPFGSVVRIGRHNLNYADVSKDMVTQDTVQEEVLCFSKSYLFLFMS